MLASSAYVPKMPPCNTCGASDHSRRTSKKCPSNVKFAKPAAEMLPGPDRLGRLAFELKDMIIAMLPIKTAIRLSMVNRMWNTCIDNDDFWERACRSRQLSKTSGQRHLHITRKNLIVSSDYQRCVKCLGSNGKESKLIPGILLCRQCDRTLFTKITLTRAKTEYKLNDSDLQRLNSIQVANPLSYPMTLFLESDVIQAAHDKHGGPAGLEEPVKKSQKRSAVIAATKANRRAERHEVLLRSLENEGIEFRDDSMLCSSYINGVTTVPLEEVVATMVHMHVLYDHSPYEVLLDSHQSCQS